MALMARKPRAKRPSIEVFFDRTDDGLVIADLLVKPGVLAEEPTLRHFAERLIALERLEVGVEQPA